MGYYWISTSGTPDPNARVFVANHMSQIDAMYAFWMIAPCIVAKAEVGTIPILGNITRALRAIYVDRSDPDSRVNTVASIKARAADLEGPAVMLFPEGTTTNGTAVINFKLGAFLPGQPVQPMAISFPNVHLNPGIVGARSAQYTIFLRLLFQVVNYMEVQFCPLIVPSESELSDPAKFAEHARLSIAKALNVPITNHGFSDMLLHARALELGVEHDVENVELGSIEKLYGRVGVEDARCQLEHFIGIAPTGKANAAQFLAALGLPTTDSTLEMFEMMDTDEDGVIDFKEFLWARVHFSQAHPHLEDVLENLFAFFDSDKSGTLELQEIVHGVTCLMGSAEARAKVVDEFSLMDTNNDGLISMSEFKAYTAKRPELVALIESKLPDCNEEDVDSVIQSEEEDNKKEGAMVTPLEELAVKF